MKFVVSVYSAILVTLSLASGVSAQAGATGPVLLASAAPGPAIPGLAAPMAAAPAPQPQPEPEPQGVYGVFPNYHWQAYAGYTYLRFYEIPNVAGNTDGFNFSVAYYAKDWLAADGEVMATFGSQGGTSTTLVSEMGGVRVRWPSGGRLDVWVHALAGGSHFSPKTVFGGQEAFGYEAGGGVDFSPHHRRLGYRLQADMVGTHYFGTFQYSPKVSFGVVYKF
jgi:hypothetical protein